VKSWKQTEPLHRKVCLAHEHLKRLECEFTLPTRNSPHLKMRETFRMTMHRRRTHAILASHLILAKETLFRELQMLCFLQNRVVSVYAKHDPIFFEAQVASWPKLPNHPSGLPMKRIASVWQFINAPFCLNKFSAFFFQVTPLQLSLPVAPISSRTFLVIQL